MDGSFRIVIRNNMTDNLELETTLWQAANKLHNDMDTAEYKDLLGLCKYATIEEVRKIN